MGTSVDPICEKEERGVRTMYQKTAQKLLDFISQSPSCYHVVDNFKKRLEAEGFEELQEHEGWDLAPGGGYYVTRNGSSIIAFTLPHLPVTNFLIAASHSDSPTFKIKENPEMLVDGHYLELNAEGYGGMLCSTWFDRPLSIAGRAVVSTTAGVASRLVNFDRDLVMIPSCAIHMNRKANDGYSYNLQKDMIPLFGQETDQGSFMKLLAEELQVEPEEILGTDLFLYNRTRGCIWGSDDEFIASPKLDDLECAYSTMEALISIKHKLDADEFYAGTSVNICAVFDNEEVGSSTRQGADSSFLEDILGRIGQDYAMSAEEYLCCLAGSFMVSADNAHAVHPHHLDKADPTNRPYMNRGVVIKYNANQKYTTDAVSAAIFRRICETADIPVQTYVNRSDVPGGSTLGNLSGRHVSIDSVDIGLAQLAMHSSYETAGVMDVWHLQQAVEAFFGTAINRIADGQYETRTL